MKRAYSTKIFVTAFLAWTMALLPLAAIGQTRIVMPKNRYKIQDDVKAGRDAAAEVEKQMPILNDSLAQQYVESVGRRLVASIPPEFQQPAFDYEFKVVNASDINAFALPGGPMFVNRGMIEAAKNEGEMAGVMAHEMSHVALRHATAQATKQGSFGNQLGIIGMVLGGAILGGESGAQLGAAGAQIWMTKYSREYEKQADILGSHIMANAGYDPRDLANMFRTIEQQGGSRGPQWLSDHPDPGNRYNYINQEASFLRVSSDPIKVTRDFSRVQERLRSMPRAQTMAQIAQNYKNGRGPTQSPTNGGRYSDNIGYPSTRTQVYSDGIVRMSFPDNWRQFPSDNSVQFAPEGAYGDNGITHGALVGTDRSSSNNLNQSTQDYVNGILQGNSYLRQQSGFSRYNFAGQNGYMTTLSGRSPITGRTEVVTVYTTQLSDGRLFYIDTVSPQEDSYRYNSAFRGMINSVRFNN
jgi:Putative Zn-dependent protease, contains TPR repeats